MSLVDRGRLREEGRWMGKKSGDCASKKRASTFVMVYAGLAWGFGAVGVGEDDSKMKAEPVTAGSQEPYRISVGGFQLPRSIPLCSIRTCMSRRYKRVGADPLRFPFLTPTGLISTHLTDFHLEPWPQPVRDVLGTTSFIFVR